MLNASLLMTTTSNLFKSVLNLFSQMGSFESGKTVTLRVDHYDVDAFGQTPLDAQVFITIAGDTVYSQSVTTTLRDTVEIVNDHIEEYSIEQLNALISMMARNHLMRTWRVENILAIN